MQIFYPKEKNNQTIKIHHNCKSYNIYIKFDLVYLDRNYSFFRRNVSWSGFGFQTRTSIGLWYRGRDRKSNFGSLRSQFLRLERIDLGLEFRFECEGRFSPGRFRTRHRNLGFARLSRSG